ncbi:MAG TPA: hypothetical protein VKX49_12870 [Bryobacteraceae bacterium]|nr:hypothetical protein [Bryobacteraceae bacterium]
MTYIERHGVLLIWGEPVKQNELERTVSELSLRSLVQQRDQYIELLQDKNRTLERINRQLRIVAFAATGLLLVVALIQIGVK